MSEDDVESALEATLEAEIPPHEQPIEEDIELESPGNSVPGVNLKCNHDAGYHGNLDYTCSPSELGPMQKLFCKKHRHGFYGACETHLLEQIALALRDLVDLVTPPPPPPAPVEPSVQSLVSVPDDLA